MTLDDSSVDSANSVQWLAACVEETWMSEESLIMRRVRANEGLMEKFEILGDEGRA